VSDADPSPEGSILPQSLDTTFKKENSITKHQTLENMLVSTGLVTPASGIGLTQCSIIWKVLASKQASKRKAGTLPYLLEPIQAKTGPDEIRLTANDLFVVIIPV